MILSVCRGISGLGLQWGSAGGGQHVGGAGVAQRYLCCSAAALGGRAADSLEINLLPFPFQTIHDQILQEYRKIKKVSANFWPSMRLLGGERCRSFIAKHRTRPPKRQHIFVQLELVQEVLPSLFREGLCAVCVCAVCALCAGELPAVSSTEQRRGHMKWVPLPHK